LIRTRLGPWLACAALALTGCEATRLPPLTIPNIPPTVELTHAPLDDGSAYFYAYRLNWSGHDPDGRVESYVYAVDPPLDGRPIDWISNR